MENQTKVMVKQDLSQIQFVEAPSLFEVIAVADLQIEAPQQEQEAQKTRRREPHA